MIVKVPHKVGSSIRSIFKLLGMEVRRFFLSLRWRLSQPDGWSLFEQGQAANDAEQMRSKPKGDVQKS